MSEHNLPPLPEGINLPRHIGIIMDGDRRWAATRNLPYIEGHREALKRIEELVEYATFVGVEQLTLWAWSTKNWKRNASFIADILMLFREHLCPDGIFGRALAHGAELRHIGTLDAFPSDISSKVFEYLQQKPTDPKIVVNLAVGYEGRDEITRAVQKMIRDGVTEDEITQEKIEGYLDTAGMPDPDLIIRTGGNYRTSGFMVWQAADAELYFTKTLFPDFGVEGLRAALIDYSGRERRFGGDSQKY